MLTIPIKEEYMDMAFVDAYFKLKVSSFNILPIEFLVGIEYKDKDEVIAGKEPVNIRFQNPHKKGEYDEVSYQVLINLLNQLKQ